MPIFLTRGATCSWSQSGAVTSCMLWTFSSSANLVSLMEGIFLLSTRACWRVKASTYWAPTSWQPVGTVFLVSLPNIVHWPPNKYPHLHPSTFWYSKILGSYHTSMGKTTCNGKDCFDIVCAFVLWITWPSGWVQFYISSGIKIKSIVQTPRQLDATFYGSMAVNSGYIGYFKLIPLSCTHCMYSQPYNIAHSDWCFFWTWTIQWIIVDFCRNAQSFDFWKHPPSQVWTLIVFTLSRGHCTSTLQFSAPSGQEGL